MVENQVRPNRVTDNSVINAMASIPREKFVPETAVSIAYGDKAVEIGKDRYLMAPLVCAQLLQEAKISTNDIVLNIASGLGYTVAILAKISKAVVGVEVDPILAQKASSVMVELGIDNVLIVEKELVTGYSKQAPYDVIIFDGAIEQVPRDIMKQLVDGGRLVSVIYEESNSLGSLGKVVVQTKFGDLLSKIERFDASAPILLDFRKERSFQF
jgi:protein-L-isoaspartate(D-aspartate) O-methyltransferase